MSALTDVLHSIVDGLTLNGDPARQVLHDQIEALITEAKTDVKKDIKSLLEDNG